jgi:hypothetical protein
VTGPFEPVTVPDARDVGEEAQVDALQRMKPSTHAGRWTAFCGLAAFIAEAVYRLFA